MLGTILLSQQPYHGANTMALKSTYKTPEGHIPAYWRISDLRYVYEKPHGNEMDEEGKEMDEEMELSTVAKKVTNYIFT